MGTVKAMATNEPAGQLVGAGLWTWLKGTGLERFELVRAGAAWTLRGMILAASGDRSAAARYEVSCGPDWRTRRVEVRLRDIGGERVLPLEVSDGRWYEAGRERDSVRGCLDVDLSWSPSTNTLPIRRLGLEVGQASGVLTAAWVRFPDLALIPLEQEYRRLSDRRYRYTSRGGAFTAEIDVDEHGLVVNYGDFWKRVAGS